MKTKKHFITALMLALFALTACSGKKTDAAQNADATPDALITAAKDNNVAEARRLIADGADVKAKDNDGSTALMWAAWRNSPEVAKILLESGADVKATDKYGNTALWFAAANDSPDVARLLLAAGADVNAKDKYGDAALIIAARENSPDVAKILLESGADVKATDEYGNTALMWAAGNNSLDAARLLLAAALPVPAEDFIASFFSGMRYETAGCADGLFLSCAWADEARGIAFRAVLHAADDGGALLVFDGTEVSTPGGTIFRCVLPSEFFGWKITVHGAGERLSVMAVPYSDGGKRVTDGISFVWDSGHQAFTLSAQDRSQW